MAVHMCTKDVFWSRWKLTSSFLSIGFYCFPSKMAWRCKWHTIMYVSEWVTTSALPTFVNHLESFSSMSHDPQIVENWQDVRPRSDTCRQSSESECDFNDVMSTPTLYKSEQRAAFFTDVHPLYTSLGNPVITPRNWPPRWHTGFHSIKNAWQEQARRTTRCVQYTITVPHS